MEVKDSAKVIGKVSGSEVLQANMSFEAQKIFATRKFDADVYVHFITRRACFGWLSICSF
ncbi:MAG: hypothetical protein DMG72_17360 [Acidobacteria bacterium]|nr:MAG: hypothetical protein DMG72_17360 [Acidobacteriota bacterium]